MGAPAEVLEEIFTVIEGGRTIGTSAEVIQFPSDNGSTTYTAVNKTFQGTNGTGLNYWVAAVVEGASAISAGALMIVTGIPEFVALAVPCLGIGVGTALYNIDPEGWTNLAVKLANAGLTVQGKVVSFLTENGIVNFPPTAIELLIEELDELGFLEGIDDKADVESTTGLDQRVIDILPISCAESLMFYGAYISGPGEGADPPSEYARVTATAPVKYFVLHFTGGSVPYACSTEPFTAYTTAHNEYGEYHNTYTGEQVTFNGKTFYCNSIRGSSTDGMITYMTLEFNDLNFALYKEAAYVVLFGDITEGANKGYYQKGAIRPDPNVAFPLQYPDWIPFEFPDLSGWRIPMVYPAQYPALLPEAEPYQKQAQNPDADPDEEADKGIEIIEDPATNPATATNPGAAIEPDPDPSIPDPDPLPDFPEDTGEDPINPDPPIPPSPAIVVPGLPSAVNSSKLFTVYNPSASQLGQLGGYLWDNDLIDILRKIWQNPLDGIISLIQVYATPVTGGNSNIILGYLDSGVSAPVVSDQFVTIDCGTITVEELNENCLDYIPYTKMELYLPFVGITEINTNEFMSGQINVKYKVDVYTGTCLAEVKCIRSRDLANGAILYTFSGNCSQQIPLTSGDAKGLFGALVSAVGVGLGVASGGASFATALGAMAKDGIQSVSSREMLHIGHSGNLSANAGIMGQKKPFLIINRERPYTANNYNKFYGFPANKSINPGNHSGFLRMKAGRLQSAATEEEKAEIFELLTKGVIM